MAHRLAELVGWHERRESHRSVAHDVAAQHDVLVRRYLTDQPKHVGILADGQCVDLVLAAGRQPWVNDSYLYMLLTDNGTLDASELIERVRDGHIQWLFFHDSIEAHLRKVERKSNVWPPEVLECLSECFERMPAPAGLFVYRSLRTCGRRRNSCRIGNPCGRLTLSTAPIEPKLLFTCRRSRTISN